MTCNLIVDDDLTAAFMTDVVARFGTRKYGHCVAPGIRYSYQIMICDCVGNRLGNQPVVRVNKPYLEPSIVFYDTASLVAYANDENNVFARGCAHGPTMIDRDGQKRWFIGGIEYAFDDYVQMIFPGNVEAQCMFKLCQG